MVSFRQQVHTDIAFRKVIEWQTVGFPQEHDVFAVGNSFATKSYTYVPGTFFDMDPVVSFASAHNLSKASHNRPSIVKPIGQQHLFASNLFASSTPLRQQLDS
jgi:hypothetical protein